MRTVWTDYNTEITLTSEKEQRAVRQAKFRKELDRIAKAMDREERLNKSRLVQLFR